MRLKVLDNGHRPLQKVPLGIIRLIVGQVPPPILVMSYRREHFGKYMAPCFHQAMRGSTEWSSFETELFAAFVSNLNRCVY
ncbi:MAG: hypothetical protein JOZ75_04195 [Candidatus Dormibacteraeota bacterium]|nr:hypothetical protein [Candidatus Dormibacteraeota bacterium]